MPQISDIVLGGRTYQLLPGQYKKVSGVTPAAPIAGSEQTPTRARRLVLTPGGLGQRQAFADQLAQGWDSVGVAPVFDGQGVEPFPNVTDFADGNLLDTPSVTLRAHGQVAGNAAFIGLGRRIYKSVLLSNGAWAAFTAAADCGAGFTISGLAYYQDDLLVMFSTGQDIRKFNTTTNALSVWRSGERGVVGAGYKGQLIYAPLAANNQEELRLSGTKWNGNAVTHLRYLDSPIVNMALFNGQVAITTKTSLYLMGGDPYPGEADDAAVTADTSKAPAWLGDPVSLMTHGQFAAGDDFVFLASYRGRLYTWLAGRVAEFDDSTEQGRWLRMGPEGATCYGGCVAGDWLLVAIASRYGNAELWGFDGQGWWLFLSRANPAAIWPNAVGGAGNRELVLFRDAIATYDLARLRWRSTSINTYAAGGTWTSSLIDGDDPTRDKHWRAAGAAFAEPASRGNAGSGDSITIALEYSVDGGVTWTQATSLVTSSASARSFTLSSLLIAVPDSRYLQLRVLWSSISDWAPVLTTVWAEFESAHQPALRRRWELSVDAGDGAIRRDSSVDPETGRQKITALWSAWEAQTPLLYEDVEGPWTPAVATPASFVWLAADVMGGGGVDVPVPAWPDLSGNGHDAANAVAAEQPQRVGNAQNGLPMVRFDGADDDLSIPALTLPQPFMMFLVARVNADDAGWLWLSSVPTLGARLSGASGQDLIITAGTNASFTLPDYTDDVTHLLAVVYNGASSLITWDGLATATVNAGANGLSASSSLFLGSQGGTPAAFLAADYGELIIVAGAAAAERQRYEGYLAHKWGITAQLDAAHPYKTAPPGSYQVLIAELEEKVAKPADAGRWGESQVALTLIETF